MGETAGAAPRRARDPWGKGGLGEELLPFSEDCAQGRLKRCEVGVLEPAEAFDYELPFDGGQHGFRHRRFEEASAFPPAMTSSPTPKGPFT